RWGSVTKHQRTAGSLTRLVSRHVTAHGAGRMYVLDGAGRQVPVLSAWSATRSTTLIRRPPRARPAPARPAAAPPRAPPTPRAPGEARATAARPPLRTAPHP